MKAHRGDSSIGTVVGLLVFLVAIGGTVFLDWTWENPDGDLLPLVLGVGAAAVAVLVVIHNRRS